MDFTLPDSRNICHIGARLVVVTNRGVVFSFVSKAGERESAEPASASYSNVEHSNDPGDGIIGSNDRAWNPLARPHASNNAFLSKLVFTLEDSLFPGTVDGLIYRLLRV